MTLSELDSAIAKHRGWMESAGYYMPADRRPRHVSAAETLLARTNVANRGEGVHPSYHSDPRLWTRLLEEMKGAVGFYRLNGHHPDGWGACAKLPTVHYATTPGEAVCRAYAKLHGLTT